MLTTCNYILFRILKNTMVIDKYLEIVKNEEKKVQNNSEKAVPYYKYKSSSVFFKHIKPF